MSKTTDKLGSLLYTLHTNTPATKPGDIFRVRVYGSIGVHPEQEFFTNIPDVFRGRTRKNGKGRVIPRSLSK